MAEPVRCQWAVEHPGLLDYHDSIWGTQTHDDRLIFAAYGQCVLHAGLLWTAMLKKRPVFARAFDDWDIDTVAGYDAADTGRVLETDGRVRNAVKVGCVVHNARMIQRVRQDHGSFAAYVWQFTGGAPLERDESDAKARQVAGRLSTDLKRCGFKFSGPATAYGLMEDIAWSTRTTRLASGRQAPHNGKR